MIIIVFIAIILAVLFITGLALLIVGIVNKQKLREQNIRKNWPLVLIIVGSVNVAISIIIFTFIYFFILTAFETAYL